MSESEWQIDRSNILKGVRVILDSNALRIKFDTHSVISYEYLTISVFDQHKIHLIVGMFYKIFIT